MTVFTGSAFPFTREGGEPAHVGEQHGELARAGAGRALLPGEDLVADRRREVPPDALPLLLVERDLQQHAPQLPQQQGGTATETTCSTRIAG